MISVVADEKKNTDDIQWVCWSNVARLRTNNYAQQSSIHLQDLDNGGATTLCGIATNGYWGFVIHRVCDGDAGVNCKRCIRVRDKDIK